MSRRDPRRGIVLLAVIALTAMASLVVGVGVIAAQTQAIGARAAVSQAQMRAAFDAALATAIYQMLATDAPAFSADGRLSRWTMGEVEIDLRIVAEAGRLDLNSAPGDHLNALARRLGARPAEADLLARHYASQRGAVRDPVEVRGWPGMSAPLFAAMAPYLTVHGEEPQRAELSPGALLAARAPANLREIEAARREGLPARASQLTRYALFLDIAAPDGARRGEMVIIVTPGATGPYEILSRRRLNSGAVAGLFAED